MNKIKSIFKGLRRMSNNNPAIVIAFGWVVIMPSLGTLFLVPLFISQAPSFDSFDILEFQNWTLYLSLTAILMGLALLPTTMVAGLTGFLMGWKAFIFVILAYTVATLIGYGLGKKVDRGSLEMLFSEYPKVRDLVEQKRDNMGELIFFVRLSPIIPFALSNLLFALLSTGWKRVIVYGLFGMLPRTTLVFFSGTLASDIYAAFQQEGISGKGWFLILLLVLSIVGIWRFFKTQPK